ncbi:hypothetical protein XPA_005162 [Xanthoria parietina]
MPSLYDCLMVNFKTVTFNTITIDPSSSTAADPKIKEMKEIDNGKSSGLASDPLFEGPSALEKRPQSSPGEGRVYCQRQRTSGLRVCMNCASLC